jgi:hypothetical protein
MAKKVNKTAQVSKAKQDTFSKRKVARPKSQRKPHLKNKLKVKPGFKAITEILSAEEAMAVLQKHVTHKKKVRGVRLERQ